MARRKYSQRSSFLMKLDADTTLVSLLSAVPSSALALSRLGIATDGNERKTLQQVCADAGIGFEEFLRAMEEIDWNKESPHQM